ncbi:MAG: hypothetical protein IK078_05470 [Lachnospiraceae bacterium]|nr:hypothetical protein [Lachnospiraceae bacterium]
MEQQEREKVNLTRKERAKAKNKKRLIAAGIIAAVGVVLTIILLIAEKNVQSDIRSARILDDGTTVGQFLEQMDGDTAIYRGSISAVDGAQIYGEDGKYIKIERLIEREREVFNSDKNRWETEYKKISDDKAHSKEIRIDDVTAKYNVFSSLPEERNVEHDGDRRCTYTTIPFEVEGSFLIKSKDGSIASVKYFSSDDMEGETSDTYGIGIFFLWLLIIVIDGYLLYKYNQARGKRKKKQKNKQNHNQNSKQNKDQNNDQNNKIKEDQNDMTKETVDG